MPYPDGATLSSHLEASGIEHIAATGATRLAEYDSIMQGVALSFERDTRWKPFLAGSSETREIEVPTGTPAELPWGVVSLSDVAVGGTSYAAGTGYRLIYGGSGAPYRAIEFAGYGWQEPQRWEYGLRPRLSLTGVFGYASELPEDVRRALLSAGAHKVASVSNAGRGAIVEERQGPLSLKYAEGSSGTSGGYGDEYAAAVRRYKRRPL